MEFAGWKTRTRVSCVENRITEIAVDKFRAIMRSLQCNEFTWLAAQQCAKPFLLCLHYTPMTVNSCGLFAPICGVYRKFAYVVHIIILCGWKLPSTHHRRPGTTRRRRRRDVYVGGSRGRNGGGHRRAAAREYYFVSE